MRRRLYDHSNDHRTITRASMEQDDSMEEGDSTERDDGMEQGEVERADSKERGESVADSVAVKMVSVCSTLCE